MDKYRRSRYLSDLFHDIIHERLLYEAPFQDDFKLTNEHYIVFVVFVLLYCCHCAVFSEWPDRALSRFHKNCDLSTLFQEHTVV